MFPVLVGFEVRVLRGGYRAYRLYTRSLFDPQHFSQPRVIIIGGRTGVGKTHILSALEHHDAQVIIYSRFCLLGHIFSAVYM